MSFRSVTGSSHGLLATAIVGFGLLAVASCGSTGSSDVKSEGKALTHVHALVTDPADQALLAATHEGVFKLEDGNAIRVGTGRHDTMGLAAVGPNHFFASGHPEPGDGPAHLGLIESTDGAKTWTTLSLEGVADFHALAPTKTGIYGYNSVAAALMYSTNGKDWENLLRGTINDIAVDPSDSNHLLVTTELGVQHYRRGSGLESLGGRNNIVLVEWADARTVVGVAANGDVLVSTDAGKKWSHAGSVKGDIQALGANRAGWQVATTAGVFESTDAGATWRSLLDRG